MTGPTNSEPSDPRGKSCVADEGKEANVLPSVRDFLDDCREDLLATPHYGCLAPVLESEQLTSRLDYVIKQCDLLLNLKQQVQGLGLGSKPTFRDADADNGDSWKALKSITRVEICQSWAVLLSAGHLFGSFGTERALLFQLDLSLDNREQFIQRATSFGGESFHHARSAFHRTLDQGQLYTFFYLLALWRLRDDGRSKLEKKLRHKARLLIAAYLQPPTEKMRRLKETFRRARELVYVQMHSNLAQRRYKLEQPSSDELISLFPADALPEADWTSARRWSVLDALDRDDAESLFGSTLAVAQMLSHVEQFKIWWRSSNDDFALKLDALFTRPENWPHEPVKELRHFVELRITSSVGCMHEVRHWRNDNAEQNPWAGADFFISPSPKSRMLRVDLYSESESFPVKPLRQAVTQLTRPFSAVGHTRDDQAFWMSTARMMALVFETMLKPDHRLRLQPTKATDHHTGYAVAGDTYEFIRARIRTFLTFAQDQQRSRELRQLIAVADDVIPRRIPCMAMLATAEIHYESDASTDPCTELDGLLGFFDDNSLKWLVLETKKQNSQNGEKQLRDKLFPALASEPRDIERKDFGSDVAWFVILNAPDALPIRSSAPKQ